MAKKFHFSAGFELKSVRDKILESCVETDDLTRYEGLKKALSSFSVKTDCELDAIPAGRDNRLAFVLHNLLMRGLPTLASFGLEEQMGFNTGAISFKESKTQSLEHFLTEDLDLNLLWEAFHFIEPRIDRNTAYENYLTSWENHGSEFEERYLYRELPKRTFQGEGDFLIQLFQPQRSISSIVPEGKDTNLRGIGLIEQQVDFATEYPYPVTVNKRKGFCVEIDGSQHEDQAQKFLDNKRDDALLESGWLNTLRLKTKDFNDKGLEAHFSFLNEKEFSRGLFKTYFKNYKNPLYKSNDGLRAMELVLTPFAVARIQFVLIKAVISGFLSFDEDTWEIAVLERDVPCARLAIDDFKRFLDAFSRLENIGRTFPDIKLNVYYTPDFENTAFRNSEDLPIEKIDENKKNFDVFIDISVLERDGLSRRNEAVIYDSYFQIRSSYFFPKNTQPFLTSGRITWGNLVKPSGENEWKDHPVTSKALEFFIQNVFRKKTFRDGQLRILDRALRNMTVIGLLPTGGGKSLTYQLAGILQPGHVIVIDPIKSLMKDQVDSLARIGISGTVYINSSLKDFEERNKAMTRLSKGHALFCFVSPERLMIERFRQALASMSGENHYFSYGVIDEVHCVSEWGHNFRTPYLSLGKNLMVFCKAADGEIALFGLTATASYDVLSDVQRELSGNKDYMSITDEAIVAHENTNRDELQYHIEKVELGKEDIKDLQKNARGPYFELRLKETFGRLKQKKTNELLANPATIIRKYNSNAKEVIDNELILLTYKNGRNPIPEEVHQKIIIPKESYNGDFWNYIDEEGVNNSALVFAPHKTWYFGVTDSYRKEKRSLGIADSVLQTGILPAEKVGTFMGVDSDDEESAVRLQEDNDRNQEAFVDGRQQLMVATKAFGMGIDKPNIRFTIHNNFPDSIESFVQEAGRGGRDRRLSVACILFNDQVIKDPSKDKVYQNDHDIQESFFWNSFRGENHEKWTLNELLSEIIFPGYDRINQLTRTLNEHPDVLGFGDRVWVNHYEPKNRLYINGPEKKDYGYIDYITGVFVNRWANVDQEKSMIALKALWSIVSDFAVDISPQYMQAWLKQNQGTEKKPGIEKILEAIPFEVPFEVIIPFTNDHNEVYQNLAKIVLEFLGIQLTVQVLKQYSEYCKNNYHVLADNFFEGLSLKTGILQRMDHLGLEQPENVAKFKKRIQTQLNKKRDKQDTEKAIFRFSVIGLVDDYTVDYNAGTYLLKGKKKRPEEYHRALRHYISKYYSQKRTDYIIDTLSERKGTTEIQKILNFITEFVYSEVAKKRKESIGFMHECCKIGLERGNVEMKTWIHLYFNSKYARKGYRVKIEGENLFRFFNLPLKEIEPGEYNASLLDWTNKGQKEDFSYVLDFMHLMELDTQNSERDNLKHLRGACTRLIMTDPDNYVFRLLRAFSVLVLEETNLRPVLKNAIQEDLRIGYINLISKGVESIDVDDEMRQYKSVMTEKLKIEQVISWFHEVIEDLEFLAHAEWTGKFKERFTKDLIIQPL